MMAKSAALPPVKRVPTVTNRSGWRVEPGSLLMKSLCNADNSPDDIDRSRYVIKMAPVFNAWDRCSGRPAEAEDAEAGATWP
jgi:hypothetical protein